MRVTKQEIVDWKNHPITKNFEAGVNDHIKHRKALLSDPQVDFTEVETSKHKGILLGLEALLTYEPDVDEDGELVEYE